MFTVERTPQYYYVELTGDKGYADLLGAIYALFRKDDFKDTNSLWNFDKCNVHIEYEQMVYIVNAIKMKYPHGGKRRKTALVSTSGYKRALAEIFSEQAKDLPYDLRIFEKMHAAEQWLTE